MFCALGHQPAEILSLSFRATIIGGQGYAYRIHPYNCIYLQLYYIQNEVSLYTVLVRTNWNAAIANIIQTKLCPLIDI